MKHHLTFCLIFTLGLGAALAQEKTPTIDTRAAREALGKSVEKTQPKFFTKGIGLGVLAGELRRIASKA